MVRFIMTSSGSRFPFKWIIICLFMIYAINVGQGIGLYSESTGLTLLALDISLIMAMIIWGIVKKRD